MAHKIFRCLVSLLLALAMTAIPSVTRSALAAGPWYVATTGDDGNDCLSPGTACATINGALSKASVGDVINIAVGTYTGTGFEVVSVDKSVTLSGGWDVNFTTQSGMSILDGQGQRRGISSLNSNVTIFADHFTIQNGFTVANGGGIGISNFGSSLILSNSLVTNNTASSGGGIAFTGSLTLNDSTVRDNIASNGGGGIWNLNGTLTLNNSTISGNTTGEGGGGIKDSGFMTILNNSTVSGNSASGNGGGINYGSNNLILNNSSVGGNSAGNTGGGLGADTTGGSVTLRNTILADNTAGTGPDCSGLISSSGYNLIGNSSDCTFTSTTGDLVGTSVAPITPGWGFLQDNGGPTFTRALLPASPAIDAGNPAGCTDQDSNLLAADQRGITRPQGISCDIGAYEYVSTTPGPATSLAVLMGSDQVSFLNQAFTHPLRVVALDDQGNRVSGVTVTFTAPASGASGTFADTGTSITTVDTDAGGVATTSIFTANTIAGAYTVLASAPGLGSVNFNLEQIVGPPDDFANAAVISSLPFDDTVDTTAATMETGEPTPSCVFGDLTGSVWYAFTPTTSGSVSASTFNLNGFGTLVAAYTGTSLANLTELGCQTFLFNQVTFHVDSGTTYYLQIGVLGLGLGGITQVHMEVTPPPVAAFIFFPNPASTLDFVQFIDNSNDPGQVGIQTFAWNFGDGTTSIESNPSHQYAADGDYTVEYSITTFDGRTDSTSQVVSVSTHDVSITKIAAPRSANTGQTKPITVTIRNSRYPETVRVDLYKSTPSGEVWIDSLTLQVPVLAGNKTRQFTFNYTFTSEDAAVGRVTFRAEAFIEGANDAFPQDNIVFSSPPTRVGR